MFQFVDVSNKNKHPKCPYCEKEIQNMEFIQSGIVRQTYVFMCPHCNKLLHITGPFK